MLQVKNLTVTHRKDLRCLIKDFSWTLRPGDKAVIIGEEGNGKSTFLKLLYDKNLVEDYVEYSGEIIKDHCRIGYLPQEMPQDCMEMTVLQYFEQFPMFYDCEWGMLARTAGILGFPPDFYYWSKQVGKMSGGEKVKLSLARMMLMEPELLLLDEPSNDIDIHTLQWLERFINTCQIPVVFISHDETLIENTANVIIHFEQLRRKTVFRGTVARVDYRSYVRFRLASMEHQEQTARKEREERAKQQERYMKIYQKVEQQQAAVSRQNPHGGQLLKKKMHAVKALGRRIERENEQLTEFPDCEDAIDLKWQQSPELPAGKKILELCVSQKIMEQVTGKVFKAPLSLEVTGPQKICIIGNNGAGKSTFIKMAAAHLMERRDIHCGYMPQNYGDLLDPEKTPVEFLTISGDRDEYSKIRTFLGSMKYTAQEMDHGCGELSGGQKAKLFFIKLILSGCNVLVLDEPTRNFSPLSGPVIRRMLKDFTGAVISISHDRKYIREVCDKVYVLDENGITLDNDFGG